MLHRCETVCCAYVGRCATKLNGVMNLAIALYYSKAKYQLGIIIRTDPSRARGREFFARIKLIKKFFFKDSNHFGTWRVIKLSVSSSIAADKWGDHFETFALGMLLLVSRSYHPYILYYIASFRRDTLSCYWSSLLACY